MFPWDVPPGSMGEDPNAEAMTLFRGLAFLALITFFFVYFACVPMTIEILNGYYGNVPDLSLCFIASA